jgi:carbamoyl-phosphate synthase large subunit
MKNVMVTGVGAIIGYGVLRCLSGRKDNIHLVGSDIYPDAVGQAWCETFVQAPLTASDGYAQWLEGIVQSQKIDLLIPGIEQDVHFFSDHRDLLQRIGCRVALNDQRLINLGRDKWLMHQELLAICSETRIPSYLQGSFAELSEKLGLPFLLKPRKGYASKGLVKIHSEFEFQQWASKLGSDLMAQPIVGSDDEEYTVAIFGNGQGEIDASISLQRRLAADGSTAKAWVRDLEHLSATVTSLCKHFKPIGPTNLQFRKVGIHWKLLEINPRISSTTSLRAAFGYNEADMCVRFFLDGQKITQPQIKQGFGIRFIEDYVIYDRHHF